MMKTDRSMDSRAAQIEARASEWLARRDTGRWSEVDGAALDSWLKVSTAHRVAFLRLESVWEDTQRLNALGADGVRTLVQSAAEVHRESCGNRWRRPAAWGLAATLLVILGLALNFGLAAFNGERFNTALGRTAEV